MRWLMKTRIYAWLYWHLYYKWSKEWKDEKTRLRREGKAWLHKWKKKQGIDGRAA